MKRTKYLLTDYEATPRVSRNGTAQGGPGRLLHEANGSGSDGNGRPREEGDLAESELRYRRLFESAKDGILILDADNGQITDVNPFLLAMLGYPREELLGKTLWEIGPFTDVVASRDAFRELQDKEYVRYEDLPLETKQHERRHVEFVSNVYSVAGERVIQCNIRDIGERKEAESRTRQVNEDLYSLVGRLRRREREQQILSDMNDLLQSCSTQDEVDLAVASKAKQLFVGQSGGLAIVRSGQSLEPAAWWGREVPLVPRFSLDDCCALRQGYPHEVVHPRLTESCRHFVDPLSTGSLCVPLIVQGEPLGVLSLVGTPPQDGEVPVSRRPLAVAAAEMIKMVLSNLRLREGLIERANRDPLTGLFNRRYLDDSLSRELNLSRRRSSALSVAILDIDHFKRFNDEFGHAAGDFALRECARVLSRNLRTSDIACRWGGEEFVLVLLDSYLEDTRQRVEAICALIQGLELRYDGKSLGAMTLSAGIASSPGHATTARALLSAADAALYAAKQAGRSKVVLYSPAD